MNKPAELAKRKKNLDELVSHMDRYAYETYCTVCGGKILAEMTVPRPCADCAIEHAQDLAQLVQEVEAKRREIASYNPQADIDQGFNAAIDDVLALIKSTTTTKPNAER